MINNFNRQRFNQVFRLADNTQIKINAFFNEPPNEVRYSSNPVRMLEVHKNAYPIQGKQIISTTATKGRFLVGAFVVNSESYLYRCYEANYHGKLIRAVATIHPVTHLPSKAAPTVVKEDLYVNVEYSVKDPQDDINPVKFATIRSTFPLLAMDTIGDFLVRNVILENGLYVARVEYATLKESNRI